MSQVAQNGPKDRLVAAHVDEAQREQLYALARQEDRSVSWILRRAIKAELERANSEEKTT